MIQRFFNKVALIFIHSDCGFFIAQIFITPVSLKHTSQQKLSQNMSTVWSCLWGGGGGAGKSIIGRLSQ